MSLRTCVSGLRVAAATVTLLACVPALAAASAADHTVAAVWVPKSTHFIYQGFTTRYTCGGLRDEVRSLLSRLGARDLKVRELPCSTPTGVPSPFPGVSVKMRVLVPASSPQAAEGKSVGAPVQAHWEHVVLMPANASFEEQGNCELIEEFKESFLPLFTTRNVKYESTCVPYQLTMGTHLSAEVLMPSPRKR
jgi:hypothetical protein